MAWFARGNIAGRPFADRERVFLAALVDLLSEVQPAQIDASETALTAEGHDALIMLLPHRALGGISIVVWLTASGGEVSLAQVGGLGDTHDALDLGVSVSSTTLHRKSPNFAPLLERIREQLFAPLTLEVYGSNRGVVRVRDRRDVLEEVGTLGESLGSLDRRTLGEPTSTTQIRFVDVAPPPIAEPSGVDEWFVRVPVSQSQEVAGARVIYVFLALATIALGLLVHDRAASLSEAIRDSLGDAIWAVKVTWWVSASMPRASLLVRVGVALTICVGVELSQLAHWRALDALRRTTPGRLVLGSDFDPRDLASYALGVTIAAWLDRSWRSRETTPTL